MNLGNGLVVINMMRVILNIILASCRSSNRNYSNFIFWQYLLMHIYEVNPKGASTWLGLTPYFCHDVLQIVDFVSKNICLLLLRFYARAAASPLQGLLPDGIVLIVVFLSSMVCLLSDARLCCNRSFFSNLIHLIVGGLLFTFCCIVVWFRERSAVNFVQRHFLKRHAA